jgi:hypothetical protein
MLVKLTPGTKERKDQHELEGAEKSAKKRKMRLDC